MLSTAKVRESLVTVRTVSWTSPIPGTDKILKARIDGWDVVVLSNTLPGDKVLFFEMDALLPMSDFRFSFLRKNGVKTLPNFGEYYLVKTARIHGALSQGVALPYADFEDIPLGEFANTLKIRQYLPNVEGETFKKDESIGSPYPIHLGSKTVAERVQNFNAENWERLRAQPTLWYVSEKVDGSSFSSFLDKDKKFHVCSLNRDIPESKSEGNLYWLAFKKFGIADKLLEVADKYPAGVSVGIQAELYGPKIKGNHLRVGELSLAIFNVPVNGYESVCFWRDMRHWGENLFTPILDNYGNLPLTTDAAVWSATFLKSKINPERYAEGVVWRSPNPRVIPIKALNNALLSC